MTEVFRWFSEIEPLSAWLLFGFVIFVLGLIPYTPVLYCMVRILVRREKAKIHAFEYAFSPDHKLAELFNNEFYLLSPTMHFLVQGGEILITWHVTGAWRIDIAGIGKNLKGNAARVIADRNNSVYHLTAYTLNGTLKAVLHLPKDRIFDVKTTSFAQDRKWAYEPVIFPAENFPFTKAPRKPGIGIPFNRFVLPQQRIGVPETNPLWPAKNYLDVVENDSLNSILDSQPVVQFYPANLCDYHENGEHLFFSSAKQLREKLRQNSANHINNAQ